MVNYKKLTIIISFTLNKICKIKQYNFKKKIIKLVLSQFQKHPLIIRQKIKTNIFLFILFHN